MDPVLVLPQNHGHYHYPEQRKVSGLLGACSTRLYQADSCQTFQRGMCLALQYANSSHIGSDISEHDYSNITKHEPSYLQPLKGDRTPSGTKSAPIPITSKVALPKKQFGDYDIACGERWAGPAYSNSPPPSSLPIPKFSSLFQKRSISLEIHHSVFDVDTYIRSKSAPPSLSGGESPSSAHDAFNFDAFATENLRRILHLDI